MSRGSDDDVLDLAPEDRPWPPTPRADVRGTPRRASRRSRDRRRSVAALAVVAVLLLPLIVAGVVLASKVQRSEPAAVVEVPDATVPDLKLLIPEGITLDAAAHRIAQLEGRSTKGFLDAAASGGVRSKYQPPEVKSLEGLFWSDTYLVGAKETEAVTLKRIVEEFDRRMDKVGLGNPSPTGLTAYQTLVVASLVQKESGRPEDDAPIAAVILNRLRQKMPLQIDATLCYAKGGCPPVPNDADKRIDSPYNTYRVGGLPPTPISSVTEAAVRATLAPANVPYLYYVADKDGRSIFATTLAEHERNVARVRAGG